ncbi:MAG: transposase [Candidatus Omnitrophota bacterium]
MARIARILASGMPHHIIQRGNRRQIVFFTDNDKQAYLDLLVEFSQKYLFDVVAYCLMDNHLHLVIVPSDTEKLARGIGEVHRRYTRLINFREKWRGYLWQGRFKSYVMDESYLYRVIRYIERNPVKAGIVKYAEDYRWSSACAHVTGNKDSVLCNINYVDFSQWKEYLKDTEDEKNTKFFYYHENTGRPMGHESFVEKLEGLTGRKIHKTRPGPKPMSN